MRFFLLALQVSLLSTTAVAQSSGDPSIKSYSSYEDYCSNNPHAPTCTNGHPLKIQPLPQPVFKVIPNVVGGTKSYRTLADYCHDNPKSSRCVNLQQQIQIPGTVLNLAASWRFADNHSEALAGINLASLRRSGTAQKLLRQISDAMHLDLGQYGATLDQIGQVDQAWLSISGHDPLFLLQGQMRIPEGFFSLGNGMTSWRISKTAVLIGKEEAVRTAVERLSSGSTTLSATANSMREISAQNDFWMTGTPKLFDSQMSALPFSKEITSYSIALALRNGLEVDVRLKCATAAAAQKMLAQMRQKLPAAGQAVHVTTEVAGNSFKLGLSVSERDLSDALTAALSGTAGKQLSAMAAAAVNAQSKVTISGGEAQSQAPVTTAGPSGSLIRNIQGGELDAPARKAAGSASDAPTPP